MPARSRKKQDKILFVLDTNVLMHDPTSLFQFGRDDIFLPMMVLEELDNHKTGMTEVARNARQTSRFLERIIGDGRTPLEQGFPLARAGGERAGGLLFVQTQDVSGTHPSALLPGKVDNYILEVILYLKVQYPHRQVVLVSKDINMRIKARALGLHAEDYQQDKALEDTDLLPAGAVSLPEDFWHSHAQGMASWQEANRTYYRVQGPFCRHLAVGNFVYLDSERPFAAQVLEKKGEMVVMATITDYTSEKHNVWGVTARNREQNFALNLLLDAEVDFVTLLGQAGTGKTLLTLAAGLVQTIDQRLYNEIIMTRVTVPLGEDIGFLPGTEEEKMAPWMGALQDNLEVLAQAGPTPGKVTQEMLAARIKVKSLNFMRGRTFQRKYLIIDEAQNLTPKQMKALITRAGPGTKVVCLGNVAQIDTPYLTEGSSGLTYVVERFRSWPHGGHITLTRGERSRLADYASDAL